MCVCVCACVSVCLSVIQACLLIHHFQGFSTTILEHVLLWIDSFPNRSSIIKELDRRYMSMDPFPGFKSFAGGISKLPQVTAHEIKLLMLVLDVMVDGLIPGPECREIAYFISQYNLYYSMATKQRFTESDLAELGAFGHQVYTTFQSSPLFNIQFTDKRGKVHSSSDSRTLKGHYIFCHTVDSIRKFGCLANCDSAQFEAFHRVVKLAARTGSAGGTLHHIAINVERRCVLHQMCTAFRP